ncbi:MAG: hypothetical protein M3N05_09555, partial [Pseudomonadota bacterium]|nr:hypothetical protein [Pseudomonadota bacterium]
LRPAAQIEAAPLRIVDPAAVEDDEDLYLAPVQREPVIQPTIRQPAAYASNPAPAVEQRRAPPKNPLPDPRVAPEKKGWLSLFGGGRAREELTHPRNHMDEQYAEPAPRIVQSGGGQAAALKPLSQPQEAAEDLDIPSFLRRLAN